MRWFACLLCVLWFVPGLSRDARAQLHEAGLRRLQRATVRIISAEDQSSGVLISANGHLLTVAHGLHESPAEITVLQNDGSRQTAEVLLIDREVDFAVLRITPGAADSSSPRYVPLAASGPGVSPAEVVIACGYPARTRDQSEGLPRLGEVRAFDKGLVRSTCLLTVGDSGGPLLNAAGELIGLHRQIGMGLDANVHLSVTRIRERLQANPALRILAETTIGTALLKGIPQDLSEVQRGALAERTVGVCRQGTRAENPTEWRLGIRLDARHVVTKRSELPTETALVCRLWNGRVAPCRVLLSNESLDVVVLELESSPAGPALSPLPVSVARPGELVYAVLEQSVGGSIRLSVPGVVGRTEFSEPGLPLKLGAVLEETDPAAGLRVREVSPNGPAARAGMAAGDQLVVVDGRGTGTLNDLAAILRERQPGDLLQLRVERAGQPVLLSLRAGHDPGQQFEKLEHLDGRAGAVSLRRSGFSSVIQHDIPVTPGECGGWLVNSRGELLGMTIARRSREATLTIPVQTLLDLLP